MEDYFPYKDIIDIKYPFETKRKRMSIYDRSAQFLAYKALTGLEEELDETARTTDSFVVLDGYTAETIDARLQIIKEIISKGETPVIRIVYFVPDAKKDGGSYASVSAGIKCIDEIFKTILTTTNITIPIRHIYRLEGEIFEQYEDTL